jgi:hypothetical protein
VKVIAAHTIPASEVATYAVGLRRYRPHIGRHHCFQLLSAQRWIIAAFRHLTDPSQRYHDRYVGQGSNDH